MKNGDTKEKRVPTLDLTLSLSQPPKTVIVWLLCWTVEAGFSSGDLMKFEKNIIQMQKGVLKTCSPVK